MSMYRNCLSKYVILLVVLFAANSNSVAQTLVYNQSFTSGATPTTQCTAWTAYCATLLSTYSYTGFTVSGSLNPTGYTCTSPTVALAVANALRTGTTYTGTSDGHTWYVGTACGGGCAGGGGLIMELAVDQGTCACGSTASVRPAINNSNWGGMGTTCGASSQTLIVTFNYSGGGGSCSTTFNYTGALQTYTVPTGITSLTMDVQGAIGGKGYSSISRGGYGGRTQCALAVTGGQVLNVYVGGSGISNTLAGITSAGGYNGGASGIYYAGGGGGGSDIRVAGTALSNRVIVAGGGGGGAYNYGTANYDRGGAGGGLTGEAGYSGNVNTPGLGGYGGTQTAGGVGGNYPGYTVGLTGASGVGGSGVNYGAGGGGGYYGGGGGDWTGGGGGSNYGGIGTSSVTNTQGYNTAGAGTVIITPVVAAPTAGSITGTLTVCATATTTLTDATGTSGGVWTSTITTVATVGTSGIVTGVSGGTSVISYTITNCGGTATAFATVTVNPLPVVGVIGGLSSVNAGSTITLTDATSGGVWANSTTTIATVGTGGVVTGVSPGTSTISYSVTNGCGTTTVTKIITVNNPCLTSFIYTGSVQTYTVPAGATSISIDMQGAIGGTGYSAISRGGYGGRTQCTLAVTTGQVLNVYIGGTGSSGGGGAGGYNGGAAGVTYGAGGGGATDIRVGGTALSNRVVVAGGGGGGAYNYGTTNYDRGGAGGGLTGEAGYSGNVNTPGLGGYGGTQLAGGLGGNYPGYTVGFTGGVGVGGAGFNTGAGGGGGYYGGGGGDWTGGGGGSNYTGTGTSAVTNTQGYNTTGAGVLTITIPFVLPSGGTITGTTSLCTGFTTSLTDPTATAGGVWTSSLTTVATVGSSTGVVSGVASGTSVITYSVSNCAGTAFAIATVTVNTAPASITGTLTACVGLTTSLTEATSGGAWTSSLTTVATVASGVVTGVSAGTSTISYSLGGSCVATAIATVNALPLTIAGTTNVCPTLTTALTDATPGGAWTSSTTTVATVVAGTVTGILAGTTTITYTAGTGCYTTTPVTVNIAPAAITGTATVCPGSTIPLTDATGGGAWTSSITTVGTVVTGLVTGVTTGTTTISYTLGTGCLSTSAVTVNAMPTAATVSGAGTFCGSTTITASGGIGGTMYFQGTTSGGTSTASPSTSQLISSSGTYYFRAQSSAGCWGADGNAAVTINPLPSAITGPANICAGTVVALTDAGGGTWSSNTTAVATIDPASGILTGVLPGTATISYTLATSCYATVVVTVTSGPSAITAINPVCIGTPTAYVDGGGGTWSSSNTSIATIDPVSGVVSGVATGTSTITYSLGPTCFVTAADTINAAVGSITGTTSVCVGLTTPLTDASSGGAWASSNTTLASVDGVGVVTGVAAGTPTITYALSAGCISSATVTVNTLPTAVTASGSGTYCGNATITASGGVGGTIYYQGTTSGGTSTASPSTSQLISATGTYYFRAQSAAGCWGTEGSVAVTINPLPGTITGPTGLCTGTVITLSDAGGGRWSSNTTAVATIGSGTGILTGVSPGTATISYTLATSCYAAVVVSVTSGPSAITATNPVCISSPTAFIDGGGGTWSSSNTSVAVIGTGSGIVSGVATGTATITYSLGSTCFVTTSVTINSVVSSITGTATVCAGLTTPLTDVSSGGTWTSSNTSLAAVAGSGVVTGISAGTPTISYTLSAGCIGTSVVTVNPLPLSITGTNNVCVGLTTPLTDATGGGTWTSSATTIATIGTGTGMVSGVLAGTATITYTVGTGCIITAPVTVNPLPLSITGTNNVCVGLTTPLTDVTSGGTWMSSTTTVATIGTGSGVVSGILAGTSTITYTLGTGCIITAPVTVNPLPLSITGTNNVCVGLTTPLTDATSGGTWTSSATTVATIGTGSGVVSGILAGTTTITYTLGTGCIITAPVTVNPLPLSITGTSNVCVGLTTPLTDATGGGTWTSSGTTIATIGTGTGVVSGVLAGSATITYTVGTGCIITTPVTVNPLPLSITGTNNVCVGLTTPLTDATSGGAWTSSTTTVATIGTGSGVVSGVLAGTTTITYRLGTGCIMTAPVTVNPLPATIAGTNNVCVGLTTPLTDATTGGAWTSGATTVATIGTGSGVVSGILAGATTITYTLGTGCIMTAPVTVNPLPLTITGTNNVCVGLTTALTDASAGGTWTSSATTIATIVSATGIATGVLAGIATITYTLGTGCIITTPLTVNPLPATITGTNNVCVGLTTPLTDATSGGAWTSSTTTVATIGTGSGVVSGILAGTSTITYTLGTGCIMTTPVTVNPLPLAITGTNNVCVGLTTPLTDASAGGAWTSATTTVATIVSGTGVATGVLAGTSTITYTLATGCLIATPVTVNPLPLSITGTTNVCAGLTTPLTDATSGGTWMSSTTTIATIGTGSGVVSGILAGTTTITYTLGTGCIITTPVTVNPLPLAITGTNNVCVGLTTPLTDASPGGAWASSTTTVATISGTGVVSGVLAGSTTITYTLATGCIITAPVTVNPLPAIITGTNVVCAGLTTPLTDATAGGAWASGTTAIATIGTGTGVVTGVLAGTSTITYTLGTGCIMTTPVTVNPLPATITGINNVCVGLTTPLTDATLGGNWTSSTTTVATISGTGVVTGLAAGTTTITYTLGTGCIITALVTVNPLPLAITGVTNVCVGLTTALTDATPLGTWTSSNTTLATIGATTGIVTGVFGLSTPIITYTLPTGCIMTNTVTVNPLPAAITGTMNVCVGLTTALTDATALGTWTSSNTTYATVGATTGLVTGVFGLSTPIITYTLPTGCIMTTPITVNPLPATITGTMNVCVGLTTALTDATLPGTWTSSNTTFATIGATTGLVTGVFGLSAPLITYTLPTGCLMTTTVTVNPLPAAITGIMNVCVGLTTALSDATPLGAWSSSSTSLATVGSSSGIVMGVFGLSTPVITYTLPTGCIMSTPITVNPLPAPITGVTTMCVNNFSILSDATPLGLWSSSNTALATVGLVTGAVTGVSGLSFPIITYTLATGCIMTTTVTINPLPSSISGGVPLNVCVGQSVTLIDGGTGIWTSSNAGLATITPGGGVATGLVAGTPIITFTFTGTGCYITAPLTVNPLPAPITGASSVCTGLTTTLNDATPGGVWSSSTTIVATIGTGGIVTGILTAGGLTNINYSLGTGCKVTLPFTVNPLPVPYALSIPPGLSSGRYCVGGTGLDIQLASSANGVKYQLYDGGPIGGPLAGTGSALDFGNQTAAGVYTAIATNASTGCINNMPGTVTITIDTLPLVSKLTVTNGGNYCAGGPGVDIYDSLSATGINYQLYRSGSLLYTPLPGTTGTKLDFGAGFGLLFNTPGIYTAIATDPISHCSVNVSGSVTVTAIPLPTVFNVTGGGSYCAGGSGVHIGLNYSNTGINYDLWNGSTHVTAKPGSNSGLDFGLQTAVGPYTVVATNALTGCSANMSGSAIILINAVPKVDTVQGGGSYCPGGAGVTITLTGSDGGINYQLYKGGTAIGATVSGSGLPITLGLEKLAGTYTAVATDGTSGCTSNMYGTVPVGVYPLLSVYNVTAGASAYCAGGPGVDIQLSGSTPGIKYYLYNSGTLIDSLKGTGTSLDYGLRKLAGAYTVVADNTATGCTGNMAGSPVVTINTLPVAYMVTGGGAYCAGSTGVHIGLLFSDPGIDYQLWSSGLKIGSAITGSGSALDFGIFTTAGTYTIGAANMVTLCTSNMTGSAVITISPMPNVYSVMGGGSYCAGGAGLHVTLSGSGLGIHYQLYNGFTKIGSPAAGTGVSLDMGVQRTPGLYTVTAINDTSLCTINMSSSTVVGIAPLPTVFNVTGGGNYCAGGAGMHIGVSNSTPGINYQLLNGGVPVTGGIKAGTGSAVDFGMQTAGGTYTVIATNAITGCTANMAGGVIIIVDPLPNVYVVTGGGSYCAGTGGIHVWLSGSDAGINYQLFAGGMPVGGQVAGTGVLLDLGAQTIAGIYTVVASDASSACTMNMSGKVAVSINSLPAAYTVTGGGHYCAGGAGFPIYLSGSHTGINYQLVISGTPIGSPVSGSGAGLDFGFQTMAGTYTATATDAITGCSNNMTASGIIAVDALPVPFAIGGGGHYCAGGAGVPIGLAGSVPGINYQLYNGIMPSGMPIGGTGTILHFGLHTDTGSYTIVGTNYTTTCSNNMIGTETVVIDPLVTPAVSITSSNGATTCIGVADMFTATPANGGPTPIYSWKVGGLPMGGGSTFGYIPSNGDLISVTMSSDAACRTATTVTNSLTMKVLPYKMATATVSATPGNSVCQGTPVTCSAAWDMAGNSPQYWWLKNSVVVGTGATFNYTPTTANNGDVIVLRLKSDYLCPLADTVFSDPIVMNIDVAAAPVFNLTSHFGTKSVVGQTDTFFAAAIPVAGSEFTYQWLLDNTQVPGATSSMYINYNVFNGDNISCVVTREGACGNQSASASKIVHLSDVGVKPVIVAGSDITVLPNPNKGEFMVKGSLGTATVEVSLEITNMLGQVVYTNKVMAVNGNINERIQLGKSIANGMYLLNVRSSVGNNIYHVVIGQ
jgi:uncharacterized protein YjdB